MIGYVGQNNEGNNYLAHHLTLYFDQKLLGEEKSSQEITNMRAS